MSTLDLLVFMDESGKSGDKPMIIGGLSVPKNIYETAAIRDLTGLISTTNIHWTKYSGDSKHKRVITEVITGIMRYESLLKFNVINYETPLIRRELYDTPYPLSKRTIYTKFPERIIYGLLRNYGKDTYLKASVIIEEASEYNNLEEALRDQLNVQSMYRGENFSVTECSLKPKRTEVGLELTDVLLGIMSTIMKNPPYDPNSRRIREKTQLILQLLKNENFYNFLKRVRLFEWSSAKQLTEASFNDYLQVFLASNHELWFENEQ